MQIRAEIYAAFPDLSAESLDRSELWVIGAKLGHHRGLALSDAEQAEVDEKQRIQAERLREVAERRKQG
jgi:hypothetical protein